MEEHAFKNLSKQYSPIYAAIEVATCSKCGKEARLSNYSPSIFALRYFIRCGTKGCENFIAKKVFRTKKAALNNWNRKESRNAKTMRNKLKMIFLTNLTDS